MRYSCRKGFTLVEIMTVSAISVIVIGSTLMFLLRGFRTLDTGEKAIELQQELNRAVVWISDDLKHTSRSKISLPSDGLWYNSAAFRIPVFPWALAGQIVWSGGDVVYSLNGNILNRAFGGGNMAVANSITGAAFRRTAAHPQEIEVNLTAADPTLLTQMQDSILFNVTMRNQ